MNKKLNVIDQAITQIEEKIINSRTDDVTTRRTGDYRVGLNEAKNILESLRETHKKETYESWCKGREKLIEENRSRNNGEIVSCADFYKDSKNNFEEYYNSTFIEKK